MCILGFIPKVESYFFKIYAKHQRRTTQMCKKTNDTKHMQTHTINKQKLSKPTYAYFIAVAKLKNAVMTLLGM